MLQGHTERVTDVAFHPHSLSPSHSPSLVNIASASADRSVLLWSLPSSVIHTRPHTHTDANSHGSKEEVDMSVDRQPDASSPPTTQALPPATSAHAETLTPLARLSGHVDRLARLAFHPSGRFLATASFDATWRLWDLSSCQEVLLQEGHSRAVYAVAFHPDGSLVLSAGLDALARLWDTRTGRSLAALEGHVKPVRGGGGTRAREAGEGGGGECCMHGAACACGAHPCPPSSPCCRHCILPLWRWPAITVARAAHPLSSHVTPSM